MARINLFALATTTTASPVKHSREYFYNTGSLLVPARETHTVPDVLHHPHDCLQELCALMESKWAVKKVAIAHKTGLCPVGEASVIIAVSSAHRRDAIEVYARASLRIQALQIHIASVTFILDI